MILQTKPDCRGGQPQLIRIARMKRNFRTEYHEPNRPETYARNVFPTRVIRELRGFRFRPLLRSSLCALCALWWQSALAEVHYVDVNSTNATPPYTNWTTAATNIQDAVDAAVADDEVVVTNGNYAPIYVPRLLTVRSVNGPQFTTVNGGGSVRCVYLTNGASLSGFTLANGWAWGQNGGGACGGTLTNCCLIGNEVSGPPGCPPSFAAYGGGAYDCTLNNCTLTNNSVSVNNTSCGPDTELDSYGGGAAYCTLNNCTLAGNWASVDSYFTGIVRAYGGGAYECTLNNCTLIGNSAAAFYSGYLQFGMLVYSYGGGAYECTLNNCTLTGNSVAAFSEGGFNAYAADGGASYGALANCITFGNFIHGVRGHNFCEDCGWDPLFVDTNGWANLRLQPTSPCINAGNNSSVTNATDLDGNPRISGGTVDIGAYEFQAPVSMISYAWLQQFSLPINPATDAADPDADGVDNYHEWLAGSDPTSPLSSPSQLTITPSGTSVILTWSTNAVGFTLQSATNLLAPIFWSTNSPAPVVIGGQNVVTNPLTGPQQFYRLIQ
jgi:hypothetical protein